MTRIVYTIEQAADEVTLDATVITTAIRCGELIARRMDDNSSRGTARILCGDLLAWVESQPTF